MPTATQIITVLMVLINNEGGVGKNYKTTNKS